MLTIVLKLVELSAQNLREDIEATKPLSLKSYFGVFTRHMNTMWELGKQLADDEMRRGLFVLIQGGKKGQ